MKDYKIQGTNIVIGKGVTVRFSISGLHTDSKYFDDPQLFRPERFTENEISGKSFFEIPYMPFGDGPRKCLGKSFAKMKVKFAIALLLQKFRFELADEHKNKVLEYHVSGLVKIPLKGINLKVYRR